MGPNPLLVQPPMPPAMEPPPVPPPFSPMHGPANGMMAAGPPSLPPGPPPMPASDHQQELANVLGSPMGEAPRDRGLISEIPAEQAPMPGPPPPPPQTYSNGNGKGAHRPHPSLMIVRPQRAPQGPAPDLSRLPPSVADSLARLAGGRPQTKPMPVIVPFKPTGK